MATVTISQVAGLTVQPNSFTVPDGTLERAHNVVLSQDAMSRKRRGFATLIASLYNAVAVAEYLETLFVLTTTQIGKIDQAAGTVTYLSDPEGLFVVSAQAKPRLAGAGGNLYAATSSGILKIESTTATVMRAGIPPGLDLAVTLSGKTGPIPPDSQTAYRAVFGRKDANGNLILGAPSEVTSVTNLMLRAQTATYAASTVTVTSTAHGLAVSDTVVVKNPIDASGATVTNIDTNTERGTEYVVATVPNANQFTFTVTGTPVGTLAKLDWGVYKTAAVSFTIPSGALSTEYLYQLHRGAPSLSDADAASEDELQRVVESNVTSAQITAKAVSYTDSVLDIFLSGYLYTNPNTGEGIQQANDPPPFARDLTVWRDMAIYANTQTLHELELGLISVASLSGTTFNVTAGGVTRSYTGGATENTATRTYKVTSSGTVSQQIQETVKSLVRVINRDYTTVSSQVGSQVYAFYTSGVDDVPGQFRLQSKSFASNFSLTVSSSGVSGNFQPEIPTSGTTVAGENDLSPHMIYVSKLGQHEAVPRLNRYPVGSKSAEILRVAALKDTVLILKEDGVFAIRGSHPSNLNVIPLDSTVLIKAPDSLSVVNNEAAFVSNQGIVAASESSIRRIAEDIRPIITSVIGNAYFAQLTRSVGYDSEQLYLLTTIEPNTYPQFFSATVVSAAVTSGVATVTFNVSITSNLAAASDTLVLSGFAGPLAVLNGDHLIRAVTGSEITFDIATADVALTAASGPELAAAIRANVVYCFHLGTQRWSTWDTYFRDGVVLSTEDRLYLLAKDGTVQYERKSQNKLDYTGESFAVTVSTVAPDKLSATFVPTAETIEEGDMLVVDDVAYRIDSIVSVIGSTIYYFSSSVNFDDDATGRVYRYIESELVFAPITGGDVARLKHFSMFQAHFRTKSCTRCEVSFTNNQTYLSAGTEWAAKTTDEGWGNTPWGQTPWGDEEGLNLEFATEPNQPVRTPVPTSCARGTWIKPRIVHRVGGESFELQAISLDVRGYGSRTTR